MTATVGYSDVDLLGDAEDDWAFWLALFVPGLVKSPFAPHHAMFWDWVWDIVPGRRPAPFVGIWGRGQAKSSSAEAAVVALGARLRRRYGLYISATQDLADKHVETIGGLLEHDTLNRLYPGMGERAVGKYGSSKGWRRNRLRTASGFIIDAVGLDTAARGIKVEDARPDLMIIDDVDEVLDGPGETDRKVTVLTKSLLPAGSTDVAVIAIQNMIIQDGIFGRLAGVADIGADFLADRVISGPVPAVEGLEVEQRDGRWVITAGRAVWEGQSLQDCQQFIDTFGITAFLTECQHDIADPEGGMWPRDFPFRRCDPAEVPDLVRTVVWVDPAVTNTDKSDSMGIQADGVAGDGTVYRLRSWEGRTSPEDALRRAVRFAVELGADTVGVETDQGGDTWRTVYDVALEQVRREMAEAGRPVRGWPRFAYEKAGAGHGPKAHRASQMHAAYETAPGLVHVRGTHDVLERSLRRFPVRKPFDLTDAAFWAWWDLVGRTGRPSTVGWVAPDNRDPVVDAGDVETVPHTRQPVTAGRSSTVGWSL